MLSGACVFCVTSKLYNKTKKRPSKSHETFPLITNQNSAISIKECPFHKHSPMQYHVLRSRSRSRIHYWRNRNHIFGLEIQTLCANTVYKIDLGPRTKYFS
jgi:hypothetical protein